MAERAVRRALITGAAGGIGSRIAQYFSAEGMEVVLSDLDEGLLQRTGAAFPADGGRRWTTIAADLSTREGARELAQRCGAVDILINAAALTHMRYQPVTVRDDAFWDQTLAIDLIAPITLMQELVPAMRERGGGHVINISSVSGSRGTTELAPYACAKAAVEMLTKVAAMEEAAARTNVAINCIAPGLVDTAALARNFADRDAQDAAARQLIPLGCVVDPGEIAQLCVFLVSPPPSLLGAVITIDGGMNAGAFSLSQSIDYAEDVGPAVAPQGAG